ncbi:MAG: hypothetical protein ACE5HY_02260 [Candidatus Hydrothermarchaeales archaeon]
MMVHFGERGLLIHQFVDHHGMMEIYSHLFASTFLFIASLIALYLFYKAFTGESSYPWRYIEAGTVGVGLIGLGEAAEHFFLESPFGHGIFHYLHMISAPIALYFFYIGITEFIKEDQVTSKFDSVQSSSGLSTKHILLIFVAMFLVVAVLAGISYVPWDPRVEGPFLYVSLIPTLILAWMLVVKSEEVTESIVMIFIPIIAVLVSLLALDVWFVRYVDIWGNAPLYVITHNIQNVLHVLNGGVLLMFAITAGRAHRLRILYDKGEGPKLKEG